MSQRLLNLVVVFDVFLSLVSLFFYSLQVKFIPSCRCVVEAVPEGMPHSCKNENVVRASACAAHADRSLPASSDFGGEMSLRKRRAGSPPSVLGTSLPSE